MGYMVVRGPSRSWDSVARKVRAERILDLMSLRYDGDNGEWIGHRSTVTIGLNGGDGLPLPFNR